MNIPNLLSIFRFFFTFFFVFAVMQGKLRLALYLFILQGLSDLLDGFFARIMNKKTSLGAFLDPVADKVMLMSSYVVLSCYDFIPWWLTMVMLLREVVVTSGFLALYKMFGKVRLIPSIYGKTATACQILTVVYVLWSPDGAYGPFFFYPTALVTLAAGIHYVSRGFAILHKREPA